MTKPETARGNALLITPSFFGYEKDILSELARQGYTPTLLDERPSNRAVARAIMRARKRVVDHRIQAYYHRKKIELLDRSFSLVIVIKAEVVPRWFLVDLRAANPNARFVFYTYDALDNAGNCMEVLDCFDALLSFDRDDVAANPEFCYLPLFYTPDFTPLPSKESVAPRRYSLSFIGTLHSERYAFAKDLFAERVETFEFFFVQARWYFAVIKYLTREHRVVPWNDVSFSPMVRTEIARVFRESHAVLDMQHASQSGLTMRTFEVLASGAILVTTNAAIRREPFYDPSRVVMVPRDVRSLDAKSVAAQLDALAPVQGPPEGFEAYSLASWVSRLTSGI